MNRDPRQSPICWKPKRAAIGAGLFLLKVLGGCVLVSALGISRAPAAEGLPEKDAPRTADHSLVGRYNGSVILSREDLSFDELVLPLSVLKLVQPPATDNHNNGVVAPAKSKKIEGKRTRILYLIPEGVTPLQVLRNYQAELAKKGGQVLFECAKEQCGPQSNMAGKGGGSYQNLPQFMWDQDRIKDAFESPADCAQSGWVSELRFTVMELSQQAAHLTVQTYQMVDSCRKIVGRTIAIVDVIEGKSMERHMVVLDAGQMSKSITAEGRVALYGLFFDSGKAQIKPESKPTLEQIAALLSAHPRMRLLVVGHTDNAGSFTSNMELSRRRAEAVIEVLVSQHHIGAKRLQAVGVSYASPVASNLSEEGKAKNRRVELVPAD